MKFHLVFEWFFWSYPFVGNLANEWGNVRIECIQLLVLGSLGEGEGNIHRNGCNMFAEKPRLLGEPQRQLVMPVAQTVRLSCDFSGSPDPRVAWLKNGKPIVENGRIKVRKSPFSVKVVHIDNCRSRGKRVQAHIIQFCLMIPACNTDLTITA